MSEHPRPSLTADVVVLRRCAEKDELLLIKRRNPPFQSCRALPGGFLEPGETIEECARRELLEETGIDARGKPLLPLGCFSRPGRDPRGWVVSLAFLLVVGAEANAVAADDADDAKWFSASLDNTPDGSCLLSLRCGEETPRASLRRNALDFRFDALSQEGVAFDHAEIIAAGLSAAKAL